MRWRRIFGAGLFARTFLSMFTVTTVLLLGLSVLLIESANRSASTRNDQQMGDLVLRMVQSFDNYVDTMRDTMSMLAQNPIIGDIVEDKFSSGEERYRAYANFYTNASTLIRYKSYSQLYLVIPDLRRVVTNNSVQSLTDTALLSDPGWMEKMDASVLTFFYLTKFNCPTPLRDQFGFAIAAPVGKLSGQYYISRPAYLVMTTGQTNFRYAIQQKTVMPNTFYLMVDQTGEVLYSSDPDKSQDEALLRSVRLLPEQLDKPAWLQGDGKKYRAYSSTSKNIKWRLLLLAGEEVTGAGDRELVNIVIWAIAVSILAMAVLSIGISAGITRPIRDVIQAVTAMGNERLDVRVTRFPRGELGKLGRAFNHMAERIETLIKSVYQAELMSREAQLYALQQQINPHFLYNTLEVINSLANQNQSRQIKHVVQKLAGIFRYAITGDGGMTTVKKELQYVEDYLNIQQYRFPDRVRYTLEIQPELLPRTMPKFVLQPIVENAINHGMKPAEPLNIRLNGYVENGRMIFNIEDDGAGIDEDQLAALNRMLQGGLDAPGRSQQKSIGLANVNARLRLLFGSGYGLSIHSQVGGGACVELVMPQEGEANV